MAILTTEALREMIRGSIVTVTLLEPCRDYYAREGDTSETRVDMIDPCRFIHAIEAYEEKIRASEPPHPED